MGQKKGITHSQTRKLAALAKAHYIGNGGTMTVNELAAMLGRSTRTIYYWLGNSVGNERVSPINRKLIIECGQAGFTPAQIARIANVSIQTVHNIRAEN